MELPLAETPLTLEDLQVKGYDPEVHDLLESATGQLKGFIVRPVHVPQRKISRRSFMKRFTVEELKGIKTKQQDGDLIVDLFLYELQMSDNVDLDLPEIMEALTYLAASDIIAESRIPELTQDAKPTESWR